MNFNSKTLAGIAAALGISAAAPLAGAQEEPRTQLLGNLGGLRDTLELHGMALDATYVFDQFWNTHGGLGTGDGYRGDLNVEFTVDTEKAGWWDNGSFGVQLQVGHGNFISEKLVGDYQIISNIDEDDYAHVSQVWYRHEFLDGKLWLKGGKLDANVDFASGTAFTGNFNIPSAALPPAIPMTTWPNQDLGLVVGVEPGDHFAALLGVYNGRPDGGRALGNILDGLHGPLVMFEPRISYELKGKPGALRLSAWWNGDDYERLAVEPEEEGIDPFAARELFLTAATVGLAPTYLEGLGAVASEQLTAHMMDGLFADKNTDHSANGFYATWDQLLYKENQDDAEDAQGLGIFAQGAWNAGHTLEIESYYGAGLEWTGAIPSRDDDVLGLGVFHVNFDKEAGFEEDSETTIELYYRAQLTGWLALKPVVQYVVNPGGADIGNALAAGFRGEISF